MNTVHIYGLKSNLDLLEQDANKLAESFKKIDEAFRNLDGRCSKDSMKSMTSQLTIQFLNNIFEKINSRAVIRWQKQFEDFLEFEVFAVTKNYNILKNWCNDCENIFNNALIKASDKYKIMPFHPINEIEEFIDKNINNSLKYYLTCIKLLENTIQRKKSKIHKIADDMNDKNYEFTYNDVVELYKNNLLVPEYKDGKLENVYRIMVNGEEIKLRVVAKDFMDTNSFLQAAYRNQRITHQVLKSETYPECLDDKMYELTYNDVVYLHNIGKIYIRNGGYYRDFKNELLLLRVVKKDSAQILKFLEERYSKNLGKVVKNYNNEHLILTLEDVKYLYDNKKLIIKMLTETDALNFRVTEHIIGYTIKRLVDNKQITLVMAEEDVKDIKQFITEKFGWGYKQYE